MDPIRVVIVDDHPIVRQGVSNMLAYQSDIQVVGEAGTAAGFFRHLDECCPDLVLLDIRLPDQSGIEITQRLRRERPDIRIIILTTYDDDEYLFKALQAGAHGYLLKTVSPAAVTSAIRRVANGERLLSPKLVGSVLRGFHEMAQAQARRDFSEEQLCILRMIADGATNREIAGALFVSEVTAKRKVQEILEIMGAANRAQAAAEAARRGLV
jgi:DNA-binding NarL/FixJ family response regulator